MFWIVIVLAVAVDVITKQLVISGMELGECISVIPGVLDLNYIQNHGAAFSILQNRTWFLVVLTCLLMVGLIGYYLRCRNVMVPLERFALACITGGGIGNLIDRISLGYVTDFLDIHIIPIFNGADCFVTGGCVLLLIAVFFVEPAKKKAKAKAAAGVDAVSSGDGE